MEQDKVLIYVVLGPLDSVSWTWLPETPRWRARNILRDFANGTRWNGKPVLRALIVDCPKPKR